MAVLARRQMAGLACASVAAATWFAAAAGPNAVALRPLALFGVLLPVLIAGVIRGATRKSTVVLQPGKDVVVLTAVTVAGFLGLFLAGWTSRAHVGDVAALLPIAVVLLSLVWPEPNVLRYCLLVAAGTLVGGATQASPARWAVGGALVSMAVALVSTNRLTAASGPRLGGAAPPRGRRVASEAAAVLVIVGLLAALAASLLPPPPGQGGFGPRGRPRRLPPPGPPVTFDDRLDIAAGRGPRGDGALFLVRAARPEVWRAVTYDHWDGETWSRATDDTVEVVGGDVATGIGDLDRSPEFTLIQSVTVLAQTSGVLVAAAQPFHVVSANGSGTVVAGPDASLFPVPFLRRGMRYAVTSDLLRSSADALRDTKGEVPRDLADLYLQLPQVPARVRALAAAVVAGKPTTYDAAAAVERWIDGHTKVTEDAKAVPAGTDPLDAFLLQDHAGPPERAATAMAVMLRAVGIPARISVGFLPGEHSVEDGTFLVRSSDTHAWVEVWFPGAGWQRFDPTGRAPDPRSQGESVWDRFLRFLRRLWPLLLAAIAIAIGWLGWWVARWHRRRAALPWAARFFVRLERAGAARGRPRRPEETPVEYTDRLARGVLPDPRLREVGDLITVAAYSRHEPAAEERARAEAVLRAARKTTAVRRLRRFRQRARSHRAEGPTIPRP